MLSNHVPLQGVDREKLAAEVGFFFFNESKIINVCKKNFSKSLKEESI